MATSVCNVAAKQRRRRLKYLIYSAVTLGILITAMVLFVLWYRPAPTEVSVAGSSIEIGTASGRALRQKTKLLTWIYLDRIVCQNNRRLIQARHITAMKSVQHWPAVYASELEAMATASGVPVEALAYGNAFLDLGNVRAGCRSAVITTPDRLLHAHNLDWDNLGGLGRWTTCILRRNPTDGRFSTVAIGFPGMVGALDIINETGLALSFNQMGMGKGQVSEPVFIMIRRIAEHCGTLAEARQEILHAAPGMPFIITVSEAPAGKAAVFERVRSEVIERPSNQGWVAACNRAQGTNVLTTKLDRLLAQSPPKSDLPKVMADPEVLLGCNIYSVIFDWRRNRFLLASGAVPAALSPYREFTLF